MKVKDMGDLASTAQLPLSTCMRLLKNNAARSSRSFAIQFAESILTYANDRLQQTMVLGVTK